MNSTFHYKPALAGIADFHADNDSFIKLLIGAVGQGKTLAALAELLSRAVRQEPSPDGKRRTRFLVTRSSFSQLKTTTLQTYRALVGGEAAGRIVVGESPIRHHLQFGDVDCEVWMMPSADDADVERMLSLEITGALVSEVSTSPEAVAKMLQARVGRYPSKAQGGAQPTWSGILMEGHQSPPDSWQSRLIDGASQGVPIKNGAAAYVLPAAMVRDGSHWKENPPGINPHLPDGYYSRLVLDQNDEWVKRFVCNERVYVQEGRSVFGDVYHDTAHTLLKEFEPDPRVPVVVGLDPDLYGSAVLCQFFSGGRVVAFDEVFNSQAGITGLASALVEIMRTRYPRCEVGQGWCDPSATYRGADNQTAIDLLRLNTGWDWNEATQKDDQLTRHEVVKHVLTRLGDGGKPLLQVSPRCKTLRAGLAQRYRFKELKSGGSLVVSSQVVKDEHATVCESLGYALLGGGIGGHVAGRVNRQRREGRVRMAIGAPGFPDGGWI